MVAATYHMLISSNTVQYIKPIKTQLDISAAVHFAVQRSCDAASLAAATAAMARSSGSALASRVLQLRGSCHALDDHRQLLHA